jgi:hypothetical protein
MPSTSIVRDTGKVTAYLYSDKYRVLTENSVYMTLCLAGYTHVRPA